MNEYKIVVREDGTEYSVTLYKKWSVLWFATNVVSIKDNFEHEITTQIKEWQKEFNVPDELVIIKGV